jgi:hypothetical protein
MVKRTRKKVSLENISPDETNDSITSDIEQSKYEWDDILIIGDSFCEFRETDKHWPQLVACELTGETPGNKIPRGKGFSGASWWSVRKNLYKEFENKLPKIIILCHTEMMRLPSDYDYGINAGTIYHRKKYRFKPTNLPDDIAHSATLFYENLVSHDYQKWAQKAWFYELDWELRKRQIEKVIHLQSFANWGTWTNQNNFFVFQSGVSVREPLSSIYNPVNFAEQPYKLYYNHFTEETNINFAKQIINILNNYPGHGQIYNDKLYR